MEKSSGNRNAIVIRRTVRFLAVTAFLLHSSQYLIEHFFWVAGYKSILSKYKRESVLALSLGTETTELGAEYLSALPYHVYSLGLAFLFLRIVRQIRIRLPVAYQRNVTNFCEYFILFAPVCYFCYCSLKAFGSWPVLILFGLLSGCYFYTMKKFSDIRFSIFMFGGALHLLANMLMLFFIPNHGFSSSVPVLKPLNHCEYISNDLKSKIFAITDKAGVSRGNIYVREAGDSFGAHACRNLVSRRITINKANFTNLSDDEIIATVYHEVSHITRRDTERTILRFIVANSFLIISRLLFLKFWDNPTDYLSLFTLIVPMDLSVFLFKMWIGCHFDHQGEYQADRNICDNNHCEGALKLLGSMAKRRNGRYFIFTPFFSLNRSHPSYYHRLEQIRNYTAQDTA